MFDANGEEHEIFSVSLNAAEAQAKGKINGYKILARYPLLEDYVIDATHFPAVIMHVVQEEDGWKC